MKTAGLAKTKVFIDGQAGTTGLRIFELLAQHPKIELLHIDKVKRKVARERQALINASDITFLCLPDAAARESVALVANPHTCIIDASTAFRTHREWVYGLPELSRAQRERIRQAKRIAVPGCHASAFVLSVQPLIAQGILPPDCPLACYSITGYSGGGKSMIDDYKQATGGKFESPRPYALHLMHKHLPEMKMHTGLAAPPIFTPIVANFYQGLVVTTYFRAQYFMRHIDPESLHAALAQYYRDEPFIRVMPLSLGDKSALDHGFFDIQGCNGTNRVDLFVFGHQDCMMTMARLDNLGKGAAGAAIQCMNLNIGISEMEGLSK